MTTTYSTKSTADRGVKRAIAKCSDALFVTGTEIQESSVKGQYFAKIFIDQSLESVTEADRAILAGFVLEVDLTGSYAQSLKGEKPTEVEVVAGKRARSEYGKGASKRVWAIADSLPGSARKDVIAACLAEGINVGTAKTQYQHWKKATGN